MQVDEKAYYKTGQSQQYHPNHEKPIGRLRIFTYFFGFFNTVDHEINGNNKDDCAFKIAKDDNEQIGS